jgi:DNA-directed RNA polymerase specialized sigma24 family protein
MKPKYQTHTNRYPHSCSSKNAKELGFEFLASKLDQIAKDKLPDGCLDGVLRDQEPEIRQDAVLLALRWYVQSANKEEWIATRSLAYALRFIKLRYARRLSKQPEHVQLDEDAIPVSLVLANPDTHPMSRRLHATHMAVQAIHQATQHRRISMSNAAIALMVLQDGQSIGAIAKKLNLSRGAIHQQINRVRAALPAILEQNEEPGYA